MSPVVYKIWETARTWLWRHSRLAISKIQILEVGLQMWIFVLVDRKWRHSQVRAVFEFLYTMENHLTRFPQFWISFLIWINFRQYFLLNFFNQSKTPVNMIFWRHKNRVNWCFRLIEEVEWEIVTKINPYQKWYPKLRKPR